MQENQTKHYVGKLISLFKANKGLKISSLPTDTKYYVFQNNVENKMPRALRAKDVKLFVGTRGPLGDIGESLLHKRDKGGQSHHEFINKYGRILHLYDEIWWFLLYAGYVKLKVNFLKYEFDDPTFGAVEVSVFLTQKAITENYELKILRYPGAKKGDWLQQRQNQQEMRQEETKQDYQRFARLSLLLMLDLMNVQIVQPALIKSDKQFKIYFSFLNNLNPYKNGELDGTFKPYPRFIIEKPQYFKNYINDKHFHNKLLNLQEIKKCSLNYNQKNVLMAGNVAFKPVVQIRQIYKHPYFQKLILDFFDEVNKFIKRSLSSVVRNLQPLYQKYVYETIFLDKKQSKAYHNNDLYEYQHHELIRKGHRLSRIHSENLFLLDESSSSLYQEISNPQFLLICSTQLSEFYGQPTEFKKQEDIDNYMKFKNEIKQSTLNSFIEIQDKKYDIVDENNPTDINDFLNFTFTGKLEEYQTPKQMRSELKPHQKEALYWMLLREGHNLKKVTQNKIQEQRLSPLWQQVQLQDETSFYINIFTAKISQEFQPYQEIKGGILADEMGLGKTIMALALILQTLKKGDLTLIVVPKSVITQWEEEINKHSKPNSLRVLSYYRKQNRSQSIDFKDFDIILTTYTLLGMEYSIWCQLREHKQKHSINEEKQEQGQQQDQTQKRQQNQKQQQNRKRSLQVVISSEEESSFVDDIELSEMSSSSDEEYKAQPKQKQQKQVKKQKMQMSEDSSSSDEEYKAQPKQKFKQQKQVKQPKIQCENYNIFQGEISENKKKLTQKQLKMYQKQKNLFDHKYYRVILDEAHNIKTRNTLQTKAALALDSQCRWCLTGTPMQNKHDDLFSLIQFLRVETFSEYFWWNTYVNKEENDDDQQKILHQILAPITLRRTKNQKTIEGLQQIQENIIWIDLNEKEKMLYKRLFSGSQNLFKSFLKAEADQTFVHIFQIINKLRMACDHPQMALKDVNFEKNQIEDILTRIDQFFQTKQNTGQANLSENYKKELIEKIQKGEIQECTICTQDDILVFAVSTCGHIYCFQCFNEAVTKLGTCPACRKKLTASDLIKVEPENEKMCQDLKDVKVGMSTKVEAVIQQTLAIKAKREKVLIFTQWLEMIRILEVQFKDNDIYFSVITGSMTTEKRTKIIKAFEEQNHQTALLLSLRATSTGLNLTMANNVFLVDPWWNPAIEDQAIGRADRIGQQRQVNVYRFLCKSTIEQQINVLHQKKKHMIRKALTNDQKKHQDIEDYKFLLLQE